MKHSDWAPCLAIRANIAVVKAKPMAYYGIEVAQPSDAAMHKLSAAMTALVLLRAAWTRSGNGRLGARGQQEHVGA